VAALPVAEVLAEDWVPTPLEVLETLAVPRYSFVGLNSTSQPARSTVAAAQSDE
jgi:hypothetical protein